MSKKTERDKTAELPAMVGEGVERKAIPAIDKQAERVSDCCEQRKADTEKERGEREKLLKLLDDHKLDFYRLDDGRIVYIDDKRKAKIKSATDDTED